MRFSNRRHASFVINTPLSTWRPQSNTLWIIIGREKICHIKSSFDGFSFCCCRISVAVKLKLTDRRIISIWETNSVPGNGYGLSFDIRQYKCFFFLLNKVALGSSLTTSQSDISSILFFMTLLSEVLHANVIEAIPLLIIFTSSTSSEVLTTLIQLRWSVCDLHS